MFDNIKEEILEGILHNNYEKSKYIKGKLKRVEVKSEIVFQLSLFTNTQAFHENITESDLFDRLKNLVDNDFKQIKLLSEKNAYEYKISKKGKILSTKYPHKQTLSITLNHNHQKKYILEEGEVILPLVDLGVMNDKGFIVKKYYDKYKQINKFLEIVDDTIKGEKSLNIIDFGCGKSYLTFILYHYLTNIKKIKCHIVGLDLKEEVIKNCNEIKNKYQYENLEFLCMDVADYKPEERVNMVISLHACNTATDYAIFHAINLKSKYILSAPCCHKEINAQLKKEKLGIINEYGLMKDRFATLLTDGIRANVLKYFGYKVNVGEFIALEHSAKNVLIKGVLSEKPNLQILSDIDKTLKEYEVSQSLVTMLKTANLLR